jgi:hypothetical protein
MKKALLKVLNRGGLIRETALLYVDDKKAREAFRRVARYIHEMAALNGSNSAETGLPMGRAELGAALADLRFLEAFLDGVRDPGSEFNTTEEEGLAEFAGSVASQLKILIGGLKRHLDERDALRSAVCGDCE